MSDTIMGPAAAFPAEAQRFAQLIRDFIARLLLGRDRHAAAGRAMFLDAAKLAARLKARERGAQDGRINIPTTDANELSAVEVSVRTISQHELTRLKRRTNGLLISHQKELAAIDIRPTGEVLDRIEAEAARTFEIYRAEQRETLTDLRAVSLETLREVACFREVNTLRRPCRPLVEPLKTVFICLAMVVVEGLANGYVFKDVSGRGELGGALIAAGIATFNVATAFSIGVLARNCNHKTVYRRVLGWLGTTVTVGSLSYLLAVLAQLRTDLEAGSGDLSALPFARVHVGAWTPIAWALLLVSGLFAVFAFLHGLEGAGDRYPGYSAVLRAHDSAVRAYRAALTQFRAGTRALIGKAQARAVKVAEVAEAQLNYFKDGAVDYNSIVTVYEQNAHQIEQACAYAIKEYREANRAVRTSFAPVYFEDVLDLDWKLGEISNVGDELRPLTEFVENIKTAVEASVRSLHYLGEAHLSAIEQDLALIDAVAAGRVEKLDQVFGPPLGTDR